MGLPCMNCGIVVDQASGRLFQKVFVCPTCHEVATRLQAQGHNELEQLRVTLGELIQHAIARKQLSLPAAPARDADGQVPSMTAASSLVAMMRRKYEEECPTCPPSPIPSEERQSTRPSAPTLAATGLHPCSSMLGLTCRSETACTGTLREKEWASVRDANAIR